VNVNNKLKSHEWRSFAGAVSKVSHTEYDAIFNQMYDKPEEDDHMRFQAHVQDNPTIVPLLQNIVDCIAADKVCANAIILKSLAGCVEQAIHRDRAIQFQKPDNYYLADILALEENTKIVVYPGSHKWYKGGHVNRHNVPENRMEIVLKPYDLFVFDVGLTHAGAGYEQENKRIHFIIQNENAPEVEDHVERVSSKTK
jgi:ectoine hydroxylase-related dioxygenase (phytanoyl-CoA dioxygenase family)